MKRIGLYTAIFLILFMALAPLYAFKESVSLGKIPDSFSRVHWSTNNTTRVWGDDWQTLQKNIQQIQYPPGLNSPEFIILADVEAWTQSLASASLLAAPAKGGLLLATEDEADELLESLRELSPTGSDQLQGIQVITVGKAVQLTERITNELNYTVLEVNGEDDADIVRQLYDLREQIAGEADSVILVDQSIHSGYALPAATWAVHRGTPFLLLDGGSVPEPSKDILRQNELNIYILTSPAVPIDEAALSSFGRVTRIGRKNLVEHAVSFARYFDEDILFGWRTTEATREGGKNFLLVEDGDWRFGVLGAQLFAGGVFGPLLITDYADKLPVALEKFYFDVKPDWWVTPAEGPYNHTWIMGSTDNISYGVQGRVNFLQEISDYESQGDQAVSGLEAMTIVWYALALAGAIWTWFHLSTHLFQLSPFMKFAWILVVMALGPVGLWAYYRCYRGYTHQVASGEFRRPLWVQTLAATCSTLGFGMPTMTATAFLLTLFGLPLFLSRGPLFLFGTPMMQAIIWSYLAALVVNIFLFVPVMLSLKEDSAYRDTVGSNWLTVIISMTFITIGMMGTMWWIMMEYLEMMPEEENILWWGSIYAANLAGLAIGYIGNWLLVVRNEKKGTM
ncbi:MAG: DUF4396 domain-containing protein [Bacillota bacterium]|nr:DUF4396 domain-containing protein [Bacillota bacterium]